MELKQKVQTNRMQIFLGKLSLNYYKPHIRNKTINNVYV